MTENNYIAKTLKGLEEVLAGELIALGANNVEIQRRAVAFSGDLALLYKANLHLRTALRILMPVATFKAGKPDEIYDLVKTIQWDEILTCDDTFAIDSTVFSEEFTHSKFVTYKVKDAIVDWFREKYDKRPSVKTTNPQFTFNVHIAQNQVTISLDSSGESLHRRGYRQNQTEAPISEVLAAGLLLMSGWNGQSDFLDPFCGSGTFLIEAALIALNIPPGIYRSKFSFENWKNFDKELFDEIYQDDSCEKPFDFKIYGSDISGYALKIAEENVKSAGLSKYIKLEKKAAADAIKPSETCLVVTNPPYGERLTTDDIFELYKSFGTALKHQFQGCSSWIISSDVKLLECIGLKPSAKFKVLNGALDCLFCRYDIFAGKRKEHLSGSAEIE
jgi:putative N6-adenine-specific DNA methylase